MHNDVHACMYVWITGWMTRPDPKSGCTEEIFWPTLSIKHGKWLPDHCCNPWQLLWSKTEGQKKGCMKSKRFTLLPGAAGHAKLQPSTTGRINSPRESTFMSLSQRSVLTQGLVFTVCLNETLCGSMCLKWKVCINQHCVIETLQWSLRCKWCQSNS